MPGRGDCGRPYISCESDADSRFLRGVEGRAGLVERNGALSGRLPLFSWRIGRLRRLDLWLSAPLANGVLAENGSWTEGLKREQDGDDAAHEEVAHYLETLRGLVFGG